MLLSLSRCIRRMMDWMHDRSRWHDQQHEVDRSGGNAQILWYGRAAHRAIGRLDLSGGSGTTAATRETVETDSPPATLNKLQ